MKPELLIVAIISIHTISFGITNNDDRLASVLRLQKEQGLADFEKEQSEESFRNDFRNYLDYYGMNFQGILHDSGWFDSGQMKIFAHVLKPERAKGTIILLHGYLEHSGNLGYIAEYLLGEKFNIAMFDLPGHGLSEGERCSIDDFSKYLRVFMRFVSIITNRYTGPYYFIGHSTGCAVLIEYLHQNPDLFDKIIMISPLIRSDKWELSKFAYSVLSPVIGGIPIFFASDISSDTNYIDFVQEHDPLQGKFIRVKWVKALFNWNDNVEAYPQFDETITVIQGAKDNVVDWRYNISFLQKKFMQANIIFITNGKHQLLNETSTIRGEVYKKISDDLGD